MVDLYTNHLYAAITLRSSENSIVCDSKDDDDRRSCRYWDTLTWQRRRSQIAEKVLAAWRCLPIEKLKRYRQIDALPLQNAFRDTARACHARPCSSSRCHVCTSPRRLFNRLRVPPGEITRRRYVAYVDTGLWSRYANTAWRQNTSYIFLSIAKR